MCKDPNDSVGRRPDLSTLRGTGAHTDGEFTDLGDMRKAEVELLLREGRLLPGDLQNLSQSFWRNRPRQVGGIYQMKQASMFTDIFSKFSQVSRIF